MRHYSINDRFTTADIGLDIEGDSPDEFFAAAMEGMFAIILGPGRSETAEGTYDISLSAGSLEQLLVDWLSEILYRFDAEGQIATSCHVTVVSGEALCTITGVIHFRQFQRENDAAEHEIKAVTYYKLNIQNIDEKLTGHVVFDL